VRLNPSPGRPEADLRARVLDRLDRRLSAEAARPVALALSGGGDSVALLRLAAEWARMRRRRLLALTVDHRLNPDSGRWTAFAGEAARAAGAEWRGLAWDQEKPTTGLTAAARTARHRLIAEAARAAGARVVLFGHTADDVAEADWMRARGSTLGRVRAWSPSPVWPEGRGLMLMRPLLDERRAALRDWLKAEDARWIEDPANDDARFGRGRARQALAGQAPRDDGPVRDPAPAGAAPVVVARSEGVFDVDRDVETATLAAVLVCAGGGSTPPRGDRLRGLTARLRAGEAFTATLAGARLEARGATIAVMRDAGDRSRQAGAPLELPTAREIVWDGRYAFTALEAGWSAAAAKGRMARLSKADRATLNRLAPAARGAAPVLFREGETAPVLASEAVARRDLVGERLRLALGETPHEDDLTDAPDGATPSNALFSGPDNPDRRRTNGDRTTEDPNEPA